MSIASELAALNGYILGAYDEINTKGGTVPANKNMANLASAIASISGGGGGGFDPSAMGMTVINGGTFIGNGVSDGIQINHDLGAIPKIMLTWSEDDFSTIDSSDANRYFQFVMKIMFGTKASSSRMAPGGLYYSTNNFVTPSTKAIVGNSQYANDTGGSYSVNINDFAGGGRGKYGNFYNATTSIVWLAAMDNTTLRASMNGATYHWIAMA